MFRPVSALSNAVSKKDEVSGDDGLRFKLPQTMRVVVKHYKGISDRRYSWPGSAGNAPSILRKMVSRTDRPTTLDSGDDHGIDASISAYDCQESSVYDGERLVALPMGQRRSKDIVGAAPSSTPEVAHLVQRATTKLPVAELWSSRKVGIRYKSTGACLPR